MPDAPGPRPAAVDRPPRFETNNVEQSVPVPCVCPIVTDNTFSKRQRGG